MFLVYNLETAAWIQFKQEKAGNERNQQEFKQKMKSAFTHPYRSYKENSRNYGEYLAHQGGYSRHRVTTFAMQIFWRRVVVLSICNLLSQRAIQMPHRWI